MTIPNIIENNLINLVIKIKNPKVKTSGLYREKPKKKSLFFILISLL